MAAMMLFLILIAVQTFSLELLEMDTWLKVVITLMPGTALIWAFLIFRARYRAYDEYMRTLTGEAFLWTLGILCIFSFIYGMLAMKFSIPAVDLALVTPFVFGIHGIIVQLLIWKDNE
jgi:hypothetical protein